MHRITDPVGRLTTFVNASLTPSTMQVGPFRTTKIIDCVGRVTSFSYVQSTPSNPIVLYTLTSPAGEVTTLSMYVSQMLAWVNPAGDRTSYGYASTGGSGQVIQRTSPDGAVLSISYYQLMMGGNSNAMTGWMASTSSRAGDDGIRAWEGSRKPARAP